MRYSQTAVEEISELQYKLDFWSRLLIVRNFVNKYYEQGAVSARIILHYVTEDLAVPGDVDVRDINGDRLVTHLPQAGIEDYMDARMDELVALPINTNIYYLTKDKAPAV